MLKLLRSDFYRLFKSKSFYICTAVCCVLMGIIGVLVLKWASSLSPDAGGDVYASLLPSSGLAYGLTVFSGNLPMIISIIIAIFICAEFSYGTMKNVVSKGFSKVQIYLSKLITMIAAAYIVIFATMLVGTVCGTIVVGKFGDFSGKFVGGMFKTIGIELLLYAAITSVFVFISMFVRNLGGVIAINIVGVLSIGPLIYRIIEFLIKSDINFNNYSLVNNIAFYPSDTFVGSDYLRSAIVALVYFAVTLAMGIYAFIKSDIK